LIYKEGTKMEQEPMIEKPVKLNFPKKRQITVEEVKSIINEEYSSISVAHFPDNTYIIGKVLDPVTIGEYSKTINNEEVKTEYSRVNIQYHPKGYKPMNLSVRVSVGATRNMIEKHGETYVGKTAIISKSCVIIEGKVRYPQAFGIIQDRPEETPLFIKDQPDVVNMMPLQVYNMTDKEQFLIEKMLLNPRAEDLYVDNDLFHRTIVRHIPETDPSRIPDIKKVFNGRYKNASRH